MKYGRYQIVQEIGKGSMGVVYKAHDPNLDLMVALKVLRQDRVESEAFVKRFLAEARVLGRLDNRNIVRVYNVDEDQETVYIAMEFIEGEALSDRMQKKRFTPEEIIELGATISSSLGYAHQKGIVHRDVKPSNILIKSDGSLKITDFGIAHIQDTSAAEMTQAGEILGTPAYMSPEQIKSQQVDGRSDLFSLGIILYELCAGTRPFKGGNISAIFQAITQEEPVDIARINRTIPDKLASIIMKCLRKRPEERFATGEALAEALTGCLIKKEPVVPVSPAAKKKRILIVSSAVAATILVTVIGLGIYHFAGTPNVKPSRPDGPIVSSFLKIESNPPGARVIIDGDTMGQTPIKQKLRTGEHEVRVSMPHYHDWKAQVLLTEEADVPLSVRLSPIQEK
jgi:eukaryotic-like serine/threonine-protein kinase